MRSSAMLTVLTTLFLTSNVLAQQSFACQNGIKVCGENASVSCSTFCTARLGNAVGYFAQPAQSICSDDTPCVNLSNPQFTSPPTDEQLRAVGANLGNGSGNSQTIVTNLNSDSLPSGLAEALSNLPVQAAGQSATASVACPKLFGSLGLC